MRQASREQEWVLGPAVAKRLRERRPEIEQAALARVYSVSEPPKSGAPEYAEGLRAAVSAGLEYGLEGIERGEQGAPPVPEILLGQARLAARSGVSLDTVLRRYLAGHTLLDDFLIEEAECVEQLGSAALKRLLRSQAAIVDRLLATVSKAYAEEAGRRPQGADRRKAERVERLLDGEPIDSSALEYDLRGWHLGLVSFGPGAEEAIAALAGPLDARVLSVRREEGILWAWLGGRRRLDPEEVEAALHQPPVGLTLAIGEPGAGIVAWRLTHRQARAALSVALRSGEPAVRYADVALIASMQRDDLLRASLRALYLTPLEGEAHGGEALRATLRAYFACERNVSSSAMALGLNRRTVTRRLRRVEEILHKPLSAASLELEAALLLEEFEGTSVG